MGSGNQKTTTRVLLLADLRKKMKGYKTMEDIMHISEFDAFAFLDQTNLRTLSDGQALEYRWYEVQRWEKVRQSNS